MTQAFFQDSTFYIAALTLLLPLVAFGVIMVAIRHNARLSAGISLSASALSLLGAAFLLFSHWQLAQPIHYAARWMASGQIQVVFGFLLDPLSLLMLCIVALICFLVQLYSLGYMDGDPGFARYYAFLSLFAWAMLSLTLSANLLQLYVFWELVGLSSYLLIGFWFHKFSASQAGKKAFVMTRLGDIALFLGILLVLFDLGNLDILQINGPEVLTRMGQTRVTIAALLIFGGIIGKSAQFPLLTWLPDAMEGPTPVSALLHSATMVAAGVYLLARLFPFFSLSPTAMTVCLAIGTISMLLASSMAMVTRDIKQVWAYSTISQLGFMIMGLAAGGYVAGVFHLTTHAGFKALLFLCSGVFIHAYDTNEMFDIGQKGGRKLRIPMFCLVIAAGALAGLWPLSGFFSKELIMGRLADLSNPMWLSAGLLGAFLTAYYAFRLIFIILFPSREAPEPKSAHGSLHAGGHSKKGDMAMAVPLMVLAVITIVLGFGQHALDAFISRSLAIVPQHAGHHAWLPIAALGMAFCGVALAWFEFGRAKSRKIGFVERFPAIRELFAQRWYLDRLYRRLLDSIVYALFSRFCDHCDKKVIDTGIDRLADGTVFSARILSSLHAGMVQYKLLVIFVVMVLLCFYFIF